MSIEIYKKIEEVLKNGVVDRHSYFQLKYFVVGKEPTTQAKLWRCLSELKARKETIDALNLEIEENADRLLLLKIEEEKPKALNPTLEGEIRQRQLKRKEKALEKTSLDLKNKLKNIEEEVVFFYGAYESLLKLEELKPYDDLDAQTEYWNNKLSQEINIKLWLGLPIDTETAKTILSLNDEAKIKKELIGMIEHNQKKMIGNDKK
jgi:hypothetical protein